MTSTGRFFRNAVAIFYLRYAFSLSEGVDDGTNMRIMFGSCNKARHNQPFWPIILDHKPDAWIWMGDNIYADVRRPRSQLLPALRQALLSNLSFNDVFFIPGNASWMGELYQLQKANPGYARLRESGIPIMGTWDDHDFGVNDGDRTYPLRRESQQLLLDFLDEPADSPRRAQAGVHWFHRVAVPGAAGRCVGVALLDGRYHKTPYWSWPFRFTSRADDADFLGEEQWAWLDRTLRGSECEVNLIVSGLQVLPEGRWQGENWDRFPRARQRLLDVVLSSGARSPIILSGDVHFAELSQVSCRPRGADGSFKKVDVWEVTTSGMTHSWETAHKSMMPLFRLFMAAAPNRAQRGFPFTGLNVAVMDLKFSQSPDEPPRIESAILSVDGGRHLVTQLEGPRLPASSLGPWECEPALGKPSLLVIMATEFLFFVVVGSVMTLMFAAFTSPIWGVVLLAYYLAHRLRGARGGSGRLKQC